MVKNSSSHDGCTIPLIIPARADVNITYGNSILAYLASCGIVQSVPVDNDGNHHWKLDEQVYEEGIRPGIVKNLVKPDDSDIPNKEWWRQVQSLECTNIPNSNYRWKLHTGYFEKEIHSGKNLYALLEILTNCGDLIKNYRVKYKINDTKLENIYFTLIPTKCKNIVNIDINSTPNNYASGSCTISKNMKNLEKITFKYLTKSAKYDFYKLLEKNKNLKFLNLAFRPRCINTDKFFNYIPDTIEELYLDMYFVDTTKFKYFMSACKRFTSLRTLVYVSRNFENNLAMVFGSLTSLTKVALRICDNCESDSTFNHIANLVNLKKLILTGNDCLRDNNLITIINRCKRISFLDISGCKNITDKGLAHLAKLTELTVLDMRDIDRISSETIKNLPSSLQIFKCHGFDIDDNCVLELMQKTPKLKLFDVGNCQIRSKDLESDIEDDK